MLRFGILCAAVFWLQPAVPSGEASEGVLMSPSSVYPLLFFAVLEGAYRDGLTDTELEIILSGDDGEEYDHFIYACPLCSPAVAAFELYRSRPRRLYSFKGAPNTFGQGIPAEMATLLRSPDPPERLRGLRLLIGRWTDDYLDRMNLDADARGEWESRIAAAKDEGARLLERYRAAGSAGLLAPAFAVEGECSVCAGAAEGAAWMSDPRKPSMD